MNPSILLQLFLILTISYTSLSAQNNNSREKKELDLRKYYSSDESLEKGIVKVFDVQIGDSITMKYEITKDSTNGLVSTMEYNGNFMEVLIKRYKKKPDGFVLDELIDVDNNKKYYFYTKDPCFYSFCSADTIDKSKYRLVPNRFVRIIKEETRKISGYSTYTYKDSAINCVTYELTGLQIINDKYKGKITESSSATTVHYGEDLGIVKTFGNSNNALYSEELVDIIELEKFYQLKDEYLKQQLENSPDSL